MEQHYRTIKRPHLSEKAMALTELANRYTFHVDLKATKPAIHSAVEALYGVKVVGVRTLICHEEGNRRGQVGRSRKWKKAIVTLREGDRIDHYKSLEA
jgi:large subunit ribosomal protein L23